jgi:hypothetical protein
MSNVWLISPFMSPNVLFSSVGRDFADGVLNMGGFDEGEGGGTGNYAAL